MMRRRRRTGVAAVERVVENQGGYKDNESAGRSLHSGGEEAGVSDQDLHVPPSDDHYWTRVILATVKAH